MNTFPDNVLSFDAEIRRLGRQAAAKLPPDSVPYRVARYRAKQPIDYMRFAEFGALLPWLELKPGWTVLDGGGPQWFSICLAAIHRDVQFRYLNVFEDEVKPFIDIVRVLELPNIAFEVGDLRKSPFGADAFDFAYSISVIEHIEPETDGDVLALNDIARVLKNGASLVATLPCKDTRSIVYRDGPVYDRKANERQFYAREYDLSSIGTSLSKTSFRTLTTIPIVEIPGLFAKDQWEWGPGKGALAGKALLKAMRVAEGALGLPVERMAALRYLRPGAVAGGRMVNVALLLKNEK